MSYQMTNSSHAIDHFLRMLRYMCCAVCCWKSCLMPAVLCWKARPLGAAAICRVETGRRRAVPCVRPGSAKHLRIVSYRIAIFCLISYRIYCFLLKLYRAITTVKDGRLSWPGWLVTYRDKCPALGTEPGHVHSSQY